MSKYLEWKKKALLMGTGQWWKPSGMADTDCYAAYQFRHAIDQNDAIRDLTGHGYDLKPSGTFTPGVGFRGGWLRNTALTNQNVMAIVIRYENASGNDVWLSRVNAHFGVTYQYSWPHGGPYEVATDYAVGGFTSWWDEGSSASRTMMIYQKPLNNPSNGVVGVNRSSGTQYTTENKYPPYINGVTTQNVSIVAHWNQDGVSYGSGAYAVFGGARGWGSENYPHGSVTFVAGAFYTRHLTAEEHAFVAEQLLAL